MGRDLFQPFEGDCY